MIISLKKKQTLEIGNFNFKCCIGKKGLTKNKVEGDFKTPKGTFEIDHLYYREDKIDQLTTKLKSIKIKKNMGWCDDISHRNKYNRLIKIKPKIHHEKLLRTDDKYNLLIPIRYNYKKTVPGKGSCIFIHLTKDYSPTTGCIALKKKDFLIMLKIIKKNTKIKIY